MYVGSFCRWQPIVGLDFMIIKLSGSAVVCLFSPIPESVKSPKKFESKSRWEADFWWSKSECSVPRCRMELGNSHIKLLNFTFSSTRHHKYDFFYYGLIIIMHVNNKKGHNLTDNNIFKESVPSVRLVGRAGTNRRRFTQPNISSVNWAMKCVSHCWIKRQFIAGVCKVFTR